MTNWNKNALDYGIPGETSKAIDLFQKVDFISHAGIPLKWKIECDAIKSQEWDCFATMIINALCNRLFGPGGGTRRLHQNMGTK